MTPQPRAERFPRKRSAPGASARTAALLAAVAAASCAGGTQPRYLDRHHHAPPGSITELSLAGRAAARCSGSRHEPLLSPGFEVAAPGYLPVERRKAVELDPAGGIGHPIAHYFACTGYAVEIVVVLSGPGSDELAREAELWRATGLFGGLSPGPGDRMTLWTIADQMRISPREPFVYGTKLEMSDDESLQLRFEPSGSDARLMLVYRLSL